MSYTQSQDFTCPLCGMVDRVEKASNKLQPPTLQHQSYESPWKGYVPAIFFAFCLSGCAFLAYAIIGFRGVLNGWGQCLPGLLIFLGLPLLVAVGLGVRNTNKAPQEQAATKEFNERAFAKFTREQKIWDKLYYCERNDIVFDPGDKKRYVSTSNWRQLAN